MPSLNNAPSTGRLSQADFVHTEENCFAHAALRRIFETPFEPNQFAGSPLVYISGVSGTGKSCLLDYFLTVHQEDIQYLRHIRMTAAEFAAELAEASEQNCLHDFRHLFADLDLLIIEDLHSIQGRPETQRQLQYIVDDILANEGRVVLTGQKMPGQLKRFNRKLINRCHGGLCASIPLPDELGRFRLLEHFANKADLELSTETLEQMASQLVNSPRELEGAIHQLTTAARLQKTTVNAEFIQNYLTNDVTAPALSISQVAGTVARHFGVSVKDLRSSSRQAALTLPRQCAMTLARELTEASLATIGNYFTGRNHTTVLHACRRIEKLQEEQSSLKQNLQQIRQRLEELYG